MTDVRRKDGWALRTNPGSGADDLALLELAEPVAGLAPARVVKDSEEVRDGARVVHLGLGEQDDGSLSEELLDATCVRTDLLRAGAENADALSLYTLCRHQNGSVWNGDSGGPAFIELPGGGSALVASLSSSRDDYFDGQSLVVGALLDDTGRASMARRLGR